MIDTEMVAMQLIAGAGDAKGNAFDACEAAAEGDFSKAEEMMKLAEGASLPAHKVQMEIISSFSSGEPVDMNVLMVHAQDHLMGSELAQDLIREIIKLYKRIDTLEKEVAELKK